MYQYQKIEITPSHKNNERKQNHICISPISIHHYSNSSFFRFYRTFGGWVSKMREWVTRKDDLERDLKAAGEQGVDYTRFYG